MASTVRFGRSTVPYLIQVTHGLSGSQRSITFLHCRSAQTSPCSVRSRRPHFQWPRFASSAELGESGTEEKASNWDFYTWAGIVLASGFLGYHILQGNNHRPLAAEAQEKKEEDVEEEAPKRQRRPRLSLREKHVTAYEDRIRAYSTPDKIFRYFATLKTQDAKGLDVIVMTPQDFVRSILPGHIQPEGLGLDSFNRFNKKRYDAYLARHKDEADTDVFLRVMSCGLICFSDYLFLVTLLSTPKKDFEIAFRMFDLNGDGELQLSEFDVVRSVIASGSPIGMRHRDHFVTGNVAGQVGSGLTAYFFGKDNSKKLTYKEFQVFVDEVKRHILRIEFDEYMPWEDRISEVDFADCLLTYTGFNDQRRRKYRKRVRSKYRSWTKGITFDEFLSFSVFIEHVDDLSTALSVLTTADVPVTAADLRHAAQVVANVDLSEHLVDVIITLFDEDGDECLSEKEFIPIIRKRMNRNLNSPMELGVSRLFGACFKCAYEQVDLLRRGRSPPPEREHSDEKKTNA